MGWRQIGDPARTVIGQWRDEAKLRGSCGPRKFAVVFLGGSSVSSSGLLGGAEPSEVDVLSVDPDGRGEGTTAGSVYALPVRALGASLVPGVLRMGRGPEIDQPVVLRIAVDVINDDRDGLAVVEEPSKALTEIVLPAERDYYVSGALIEVTDDSASLGYAEGLKLGEQPRIRIVGDILAHLFGDLHPSRAHALTLSWRT
jgi:hypothetical protein